MLVMSRVWTRPHFDKVARMKAPAWFVAVVRGTNSLDKVVLSFRNVTFWDTLCTSNV